MEKLAEKIKNAICKENPVYTEEQAETIKYGLECVLNETTKTIIYLIFFAILSLTGYYLVALVFFWFTRMFAGGFHANTYVECFIITFLIISIGIFTGSQLGLPVQIKITLLLISIILTFIFAPVDHPNKPIISTKRRIRLKYMSVFTFILLSAATFLLEEHYAATAAITLFLEALSLPAGYMVKRRINIYENT
jgi:accessory gene regulator B